MNCNKKAILLIDGLPPSGKVNLFTERFSGAYDIYYVSFADTLQELSAESVNSLMEESISLAIKNNQKIIIVGVSFGGYVVAHNDELLSKYFDAIERIILCSPVARLRKVVGIETLSRYLNEKYRKLEVDTKSLLKLDDIFLPSKLLNGKLADVTQVMLGSQDSQLPIEFHSKYFNRFRTKTVNEGHIGVELFVSKSQEWM